MFRAVALCGLAVLAGGCFEVTIPAEDTGPASADVAGLPPTVTGDAIGPGSGPGLPVLTADAGGDPFADAGVALPPSCGSHCECPPGFDCINERCVAGAEAIHCCTHPGCPPGAACWFEDGTPATCPGGP